MIANHATAIYKIKKIRDCRIDALRFTNQDTGLLSKFSERQLLRLGAIECFLRKVSSRSCQLLGTIHEAHTKKHIETNKQAPTHNGYHPKPGNAGPI